jgi:hypothetical protein
MGSSASSAHAAWEIHQHRVPSLLRSAFTVGSVLTVYSLPGLADLFHSAALMGFQVEPFRIDSAFAASASPVFDRSAALLSSSAPPEGDGSEARCEAHPRVRLEAGPDKLSTEVVGWGRAPPSAAASDPKTESERADRT